MSEEAVPAVEAPVAPIAPAAPATQGTETPAAPAPSEQNQADQATAKETPTENPPEKQGRSRFERRIDAANRRYGEQKARADLLAAELEKLKPKATPAEGEPRLEQYDDIEKYAEAKAEYRKEQAIKQFQAEQAKARTQQQIERISQEWESKAAEAESTWEDFHEVVGELQPNSHFAVALMRTDPAVAYHLGKNIKEAQRIAALDPIDQLVAIGKLSAKLESEPVAAKTPSKAPPPINPVSGKAATPSEEISPEDDMRTFIRKRQKQLGRK